MLETKFRVLENLAIPDDGRPENSLTVCPLGPFLVVIRTPLSGAVGCSDAAILSA